MTLVAVSARGTVVAGTSQSAIPSGETLYTTTLTASMYQRFILLTHRKEGGGPINMEFIVNIGYHLFTPFR